MNFQPPQTLALLATVLAAFLTAQCKGDQIILGGLLQVTDKAVSTESATHISYIYRSEIENLRLIDELYNALRQLKGFIIRRTTYVQYNYEITMVIHGLLFPIPFLFHAPAIATVPS